MQKQLCPLGNSLALIIDKPLLRRLGYGRQTKFQLYTDGTRLSLEPVIEAPLEPALLESKIFDMRRHAALKTARLLRDVVGRHHLQRLGAPGRMFTSYMTSLELASKSFGPDLELLVARFEQVRAARDLGNSIDEPVEIAIAAVPGPTNRDPPPAPTATETA